jgi:hypothetical protein
MDCAVGRKAVQYPTHMRKDNVMPYKTSIGINAQNIQAKPIAKAACEGTPTFGITAPISGFESNPANEQIVAPEGHRGYLHTADHGRPAGHDNGGGLVRDIRVVRCESD